MVPTNNSTTGSQHSSQVPKSEKRDSQNAPYTEAMFALSKLNNEPIFTKAAPKDSYKNTPACMECKKEKSLMKCYKNCGFCGGYYCTDCLPKKRKVGFVADQTNLKGKSKRHEGKSYDICIKCEKQYLDKFISDEFITEANARKAAIGNLQCDIGMLEVESKTKGLKINEIMGSKNDKVLQLQADNQELEEKITDQTEHIAKVNETLPVLHDRAEDLKFQINKCEHDIASYHDTLKMKGADMPEIDEKIHAYGQDILFYQEDLHKELQELRTYMNNPQEVFRPRPNSIWSVTPDPRDDPRRNSENSGEISLLKSGSRVKTNTVTFGDNSRNAMGIHN